MLDKFIRRSRLTQKTKLLHELLLGNNLHGLNGTQSNKNRNKNKA